MDRFNLFDQLMSDDPSLPDGGGLHKLQRRNSEWQQDRGSKNLMNNFDSILNETPQGGQGGQRKPQQNQASRAKTPSKKEYEEVKESRMGQKDGANNTRNGDFGINYYQTQYSKTIKTEEKADLRRVITLAQLNNINKDKEVK